jgi:hypothetical protein
MERSETWLTCWNYSLYELSFRSYCKFLCPYPHLGKQLKVLLTYLTPFWNISSPLYLRILLNVSFWSTGEFYRNSLISVVFFLLNFFSCPFTYQCVMPHIVVTWWNLAVWPLLWNGNKVKQEMHLSQHLSDSMKHVLKEIVCFYRWQHWSGSM